MLTEIVGTIAASCVLLGFVPQIIRGYRTKKLNDVSYFLMGLIGFGMFLWIIHGILKADWIIAVSNTIGVIFNLALILMKRLYEKD